MSDMTIWPAYSGDQREDSLHIKADILDEVDLTKRLPPGRIEFHESGSLSAKMDSIEEKLDFIIKDIEQRKLKEEA